MEDNKIKSLEMIQDIINRLAGNSFAIKGFTISMVVAIIALNKIYYSYLFIIVILWYLDSYYLALERDYRNIYNCNRLGLSKEIFNFSRREEIIEKLKEEIDSGRIKETIRNSSVLVCMFSTTEFWFYMPLSLLVFFSK